jgi:hypothetical protein
MNLMEQPNEFLNKFTGGGIIGCMGVSLYIDTGKTESRNMLTQLQYMCVNCQNID